MAERPLLVCDFDGTLTSVDVGDALCRRFADPIWEEIDHRWLRGELTLPEAQRQMWGLVRATRRQLITHARQVGALRPGAETLLDAAASGRLELVIASGGFDLYIDALLRDRSGTEALYCNRLVTDGDRVRPEFPEGLGCERYAICKAEVVRRHRVAGRPVTFCGDGSSDRCAAGEADRLFAVAGGILERHCNEYQVAHVSFEDLTTVLDALLTP